MGVPEVAPPHEVEVPQGGGQRVLPPLVAPLLPELLPLLGARGSRGDAAEGGMGGFASTPGGGRDYSLRLSKKLLAGPARWLTPSCPYPALVNPRRLMDPQTYSMHPRLGPNLARHFEKPPLDGSCRTQERNEGK